MHCKMVFIFAFITVKLNKKNLLNKMNAHWPLRSGVFIDWAFKCTVFEIYIV